MARVDRTNVITDRHNMNELVVSFMIAVNGAFQRNSLTDIKCECDFEKSETWSETLILLQDQPETNQVLISQVANNTV